MPFSHQLVLSIGASRFSFYIKGLFSGLSSIIFAAKMPGEVLYPISDAETLIDGFVQCTLPKPEWTHEAHLVTGLYLLAHHDGQALDEMRRLLCRYNESVGGVNDDHNGYHETMTVFWLWAIKKSCADEQGKIHWNQQTLDDLLFDENLADRNCWLAHYSKERMMSVEARRGHVGPDIMPLG